MWGKGVGAAPGRGEGSMFRARDPQESLWQSQFLVTPKKAKRPGEKLGRGFPKRGAPPD